MTTLVSSRGNGAAVHVKPLRVLIAGAAGFIGSHLTDRLLADGHRVVGVDNFITGRRENLAHLAREERFRFIEADVMKPFGWKGKLDWIVHLASPASPPKYLRWPLPTLLVNGRGTHRLLELARHTGAGFFLASTSEVYGDALEHPQAETYWGNVNPNGPRSVYDESKRYAEALTMCYRREYDLPIRLVRIFNTYGPRMDPWDGRVVTNFVRQALLNESLTVYGDGTQTRSLQHVSDLVEAMLRLMAIDYQEPMNLGNPDEHRVIDIARMVLQLVPSVSPISFRALPIDDPCRRKPNIERARRVLGWQPRISVAEGLADVIAHLDQTLKLRRPAAAIRRPGAGAVA